MHPRFRSSPKNSQEGCNMQRKSEENGYCDEPLSLCDLDVDTVAKQRRELQLLIRELQDRDRELNDMVSAHQQQLTAWEQDRRKLVEYDQRNQRLELEIKKRNEQLRLLIQRLKISDTKHKTKDEALSEFHGRMKKADMKIFETKSDNHDLQERNDVLNTSLSDLNSRIGSLEAKEQEFITQLQLKDGDLVAAESQISELNSKLRRMDEEVVEVRRDNAATQVELEQQRAKFRHCQGEMDKTITEMANKTSELISLRQDAGDIRDENQRLKRDLYLSEEQLKRKDELLNLQKSKQDRSDMELGALRQLYERQQNELASLQVNLTSAQDMLARQEDRLHNIRIDRQTAKESFKKDDFSSWQNINTPDVSGHTLNDSDHLKNIEDSIVSLSQEYNRELQREDLSLKYSNIEYYSPVNHYDRNQIANLKKVLSSGYKQDTKLFWQHLKENQESSLKHLQANPGLSAKIQRTLVPIVVVPSGGIVDKSPENIVNHQKNMFYAIKDDQNECSRAQCSSCQKMDCGSFDLDALECSSQTTNDLLEEARRSTEEDVFLCLRSSPRNKPQAKSTTCSPGLEPSYSPTTKLQRLLTESREMVQCLESQAALPSKSYVSRNTNRRTY